MKLTKSIIRIIFFLLLGMNIQAQPSLGLIISTETDETYMGTSVIPSFRARGARYDDLPAKYSLREFTPYPGNQGDIGSCVGWSVGYAAYTIALAKKMNWTDRSYITTQAFSALYIYNQIKVSGCSQGSIIYDACALLKKQGDVKSNVFDYPANDCMKSPSLNEIGQAAQNKVKDFYRLFDVNASAKEKIYKVKHALADGNPVIIGMSLRQNFADIRGSGSNTWNPNIGNTAPWGGHAMCVVGFNEGRQAFEIMNSWGKDWGDNGFVWVKYNDFAQYCKYAYTIVINEDIKDPKVKTRTVLLKGTFRYQSPVWNHDYTDYTFEGVDVSKGMGYTYNLNETSEVGDNFQLLAERITKNKYVYVFSIDSRGKVNVHWPRNVELDAEQFYGLKEAPIVPSENVQIVIPENDKVLIKDEGGDDYLIILYSADEIENIKDIITQMKGSQGNVETKLKSNLKGKLIPISDIKYQGSSMQFSAKSTKGTIVPIILKAKGN